MIVTGVAIFEAVAALPEIFPVTLDPLIVSIFESVTLASAIFDVVIAKSLIFIVVTFVSLIFEVVIASNAITGAAAEPAKSPAN